jgi:BCD family chlorophyll transporter-like MFS transporter
MAAAGAWVGLPAFAFVVLAASVHSVPLFAAGVFLIGFGGGLFGHGTLTLTMNRAPTAQAGLALGAWGAVQATAAGAAVALGGLGRDAVNRLALDGALGERLAQPATGYLAVYLVEIALLLATLLAMRALVGQGRLPEALPAQSAAAERQHWSAP